MSIIKVAKRERDFLVIQKECLNDSQLSWAARGIHAYLLGKPDDWQVMVEQLVNAAPNGKHVVRGLLNELIAAGYVQRICERDDNGKIKKYNYLVHETKIHSNSSPKTPLSKNWKMVNLPLSNFQDPENQLPENQPLLNNDLTKDLKNKAAESAAAFFEVIKDELTHEQAELIKERFTTAKFALLEFTEHQWLVAIQDELLDKNSFKKADQLLTYKLNIIFQQIKASKWSPASYFAKQNKKIEKQQQDKVEILKRKLHEENLTRNKWLHAANDLIAQRDPKIREVYENELSKSEENLKALATELSTLTQSVVFGNNNLER